MSLLRPLLALIGCCLSLLGCASIEGESRKAEAYANSVLPEPFEIFDTKSTYGLGDPMRMSVYLRSRSNPTLQWVMGWQANLSNGGNTPESVLRQYHQAQTYLHVSRMLYNTLHADPALPPLQVRVWFDSTSSTYTHSPKIFLYGDLANDNRSQVLRSLYQGITQWRRQLINDTAAMAFLKTPTADNFSFAIYFFPSPRPPGASDFLNLGLEPPHSPEFESAQYSINTSWNKIDSPEQLSANLYPYAWRPEKKQWEADALAAAQSYVAQHPEIGLMANDNTSPPDKPLPNDLDVIRYYVGLCPPPEKVSGTGAPSEMPKGCRGRRFQKILAFNYRISTRDASDFKALDNIRYPFEPEQ